VAAEVRSVVFGAAEQSISRSLSRRAFSHALALPMQIQLSRSTGGLVQTLENGIQGYRLMLQHALFTVIPGFIEIVLIAALVLHYFDAVFLAIFAACTMAYLMVFSDGARRILRASRHVAAAKIEANARLSDGLLNVETVKAFCGEETLTRRYDLRLAEAQARWGSFYSARFANGMGVALVFCTGLGATLWLALGRVQAGTMTVGDFVLVNAWMLQINRPIELLGYAVRDIGQGAAFAERLNRLLQETPEAQNERGPVILLHSDAPPTIRFENVSFSYPGGRKVLDDVSFEIEGGKTTALVGPSGSGKSSVIRLLMKFYEPGDGRILINGMDIRNCPPAQIRRLMALTAQDTALFNDSIAFNMAFPDQFVELSRLERAAEKVVLGDLISGLPDGYSTMAGERGLKLSGGERQRLTIARALLRGAPILLADEATSAVDSTTETRMSENGVFSGEGVTSIVVAHRLARIAQADQIIVLAEGRVVEKGRHADLLAAGGVYAQMWDAQTVRG
jgi:ABC-type transport system involved in Fe-S cluster assembly fused permease/ATPase subunit